MAAHSRVVLARARPRGVHACTLRACVHPTCVHSVRGGCGLTIETVKLMRQHWQYMYGQIGWSLTVSIFKLHLHKKYLHSVLSMYVACNTRLRFGSTQIPWRNIPSAFSATAGSGLCSVASHVSISPPCCQLGGSAPWIALVRHAGGHAHCAPRASN
jgi:hypothetical protein